MCETNEKAALGWTPSAEAVRRLEEARKSADIGFLSAGEIDFVFEALELALRHGCVGRQVEAVILRDREGGA